MKTIKRSQIEADHYEQLVLDMIAKCNTWAYWCFSNRKWAAMQRLLKREKITMDIMQYPYWRFEIVDDGGIESNTTKNKS